MLFYDHTALKEPFLLRRKKKPIGLCKLNRNVLLDQCIAYAPQTKRHLGNMITGYKGQNNGASFRGHWYCADDTEHIVVDDNVPFIYTDDYPIVIHVKFIHIGGGGNVEQMVTLSESTGTNRIACWYDDDTEHRFRMAVNGKTHNYNYSLTAGQEYDVKYYYGSGATWKVSVNGVQSSDINDSSPPGFTGQPDYLLINAQYYLSTLYKYQGSRILYLAVYQGSYGGLGSSSKHRYNLENASRDPYLPMRAV